MRIRASDRPVRFREPGHQIRTRERDVEVLCVRSVPALQCPMRIRAAPANASPRPRRFSLARFCGRRVFGSVNDPQVFASADFAVCFDNIASQFSPTAAWRLSFGHCAVCAGTGTKVDLAGSNYSQKCSAREKLPCGAWSGSRLAA